MRMSSQTRREGLENPEAPELQRAVIRGRTVWSQLSSQHCPLLVRRFLLNVPSLLSELGNSDSRH